MATCGARELLLANQKALLKHEFGNRPKEGTILKNSMTVTNDSGNQLNFDIGMQPYNVTQYGQSSTVFLR